jgi:antitoxin (DNA-binding transcriptional repressor) of toxin-antitoxin stability system
MQTLTVSELEQNFEALIERVEAGESFLLIDNGIPIATVMSIGSDQSAEASGALPL